MSDRTHIIYYWLNEVSTRLWCGRAMVGLSKKESEGFPRFADGVARHLLCKSCVKAMERARLDDKAKSALTVVS